jgi:hypothetical protein
VAEGIDGFAKGSVNFTIGKLIDGLKAFERFVRLVGGRLWESERRLDSTRVLLLRADRFQKG